MSRITLPRQVGIVVATARHARGITQSQLAHDAGVSRQLVNRLETGSATGIALGKLLAILDAAGCALEVYPLDAKEVHEAKAPARVNSPKQVPADFDYPYELDETLFAPREEAS